MKLVEVRLYEDYITHAEIMDDIWEVISKPGIEYRIGGYGPYKAVAILGRDHDESGVSGVEKEPEGG